MAHVFQYSTPTSLSEALGLIGSGGMPIAGGQSLIPMMKFRLAAPKHLVDLSRIAELAEIREDGGAIRIGAMATHFQIEASQLLKTRCPLLPDTARQIGDIQVRNLGTMGGAIAHADPSSDYLASLLALEAKVRVATASGERVVAIEDLIVDAFTAALKPGETIVEIVVPTEEPGTRAVYEKVTHPASGFAVVGVAARVHKANGKIKMARIGVTGLCQKPFRARTCEDMLELSEGPEDLSRAAWCIAAGVEPKGDQHAPAEQRRHLAQVHTLKALRAVTD